MDPFSLLLPVIIVVVFYFLIIKPGKTRQRQAMETQKSLVPGAEVRTIAGLYATVTEVEDDSVVLEIAPDVHCRFVKTAIAAVLSGPDDDDTEHDDVTDGTADDTDDAHGAHAADDDVTLDKKLDGDAENETVDVTKSDAGDRLRKDDKQD